MKQQPISFSLSPENIEYVLDNFGAKHRNKSHWLDDLITHLRGKAETNKPVKRSKAKTYPSNIEDNFNLLWQAKGKCGAKQKAYQKYKSMLLNETDNTCNDLTELLIADIESQVAEIGFKELHLTTYLNQERWDR